MAYPSQQNFRNDKIPNKNYQNFNPIQKGNMNLVEGGNLQNIPSIQYVQHVQHVQYVQHIQHVQHVQHVQNVPNVQHVQSAPPAQCAKNIPKVQHVQNTPLVQNVPKVQHVQSTPPVQQVKNIPKAQNAPKVHVQAPPQVHHVQSAPQVHHMQNVPKAHYGPNVQIVPNIPNIPNVQNVQIVPNVQNVQKVAKVQNVQIVPNMPNVQIVPNIKKVQNVQSVPNMPNVHIVPNVQNVQKTQNVPNVQNVQNVQIIPNLQNVANAQNAQIAQNLQNIQNLQEMQNIQHMQHLQNMQNMQQLQNIQHMQHIQNMQKIQYIQNVQKLQLMQNMQNLQNTGKSSFGFFNPKDFPALKVPGQGSSENKPETHFESASKDRVPPVISDVKSGSKTTNETFASVSSGQNVKQNEVEVVNKEKDVTHPLAGNKIPVIIGTGKAKKAVSPKNVSVQVQTSPVKKKRADPIILNVEEILAVNKTQKKTKQHGAVKSSAQKHKEKEHLSGNLLDSSNPKRNKGKHREIKKQKLSNLKLTIIKERIIKQKMREKLTEDPDFGNQCFNLIHTIDFEKEIKKYIKELNDKKLEILELKAVKLHEVENKLNKQEENSNSDSDDKTEKDVEEEKVLSVGVVKFSSKFREYCDNIITPELNTAVSALIKGLIKLQDRMFLRDPVKAKARKRHVSGIREVKKYLNLKKVKMIIIAPNLEKLEMKGSVYDSINQFKSLADGQNVPYGFALDRYKLGKFTKKNVAVSAFAVLNYEGLETLFNNVLRELLEAKRKFSELAELTREDKINDPNSQIISSLISAFRQDLKV